MICFAIVRSGCGSKDERLQFSYHQSPPKVFHISLTGIKAANTAYADQYNNPVSRLRGIKF